MEETFKHEKILYRFLYMYVDLKNELEVNPILNLIIKLMQFNKYISNKWF